MIKYKILAISGLVLLILSANILSCSKGVNNSQPLPPETRTARFASYVFFPDGGYIVAKTRDPRWPTFPEPVVFWEKNFGEPFTDVNNNGVYDPGTDIFVRSADPSLNQDLNRNSRYDGPNDPWEPGFPFDDINGDGICQQWPDPSHLYDYQPGLPFGDWNGNGIWDSVLNFRYYLVYCSAAVFSSGTKIYEYYDASDFAFSFISDSGKTYLLNACGSTPSFPRDKYLYYKFTLYNKGLTFSNVYDNVNNRELTILDTGLITESRDISVYAVISMPGTAIVSGKAYILTPCSK